jgi:sec-independent protein translocase protein TatA
VGRVDEISATLWAVAASWPPENALCNPHPPVLFPLIVMNILASFGNILGVDALMIVFVVVLLFGAKKLPELAKGVGGAIREFSKGKNGSDDEPPAPPPPSAIK